MGPGTAARALLVVGFLAAWIGYDAWIVSHVVLDPDTTQAAAHALFGLARRAEQSRPHGYHEIDRRFPQATADPRVAPAVARAPPRPARRAAFADTIARVHAAVLSDAKTTKITIDGRRQARVVRGDRTTDPQLAVQILRAPPVPVNIGSTPSPICTTPADG